MMYWVLLDLFLVNVGSVVVVDDDDDDDDDDVHL